MKKKTTKPTAPSLFEKFEFVLPNHIKAGRNADSPIRKWDQVKGDIFRYPESKIQPSPAEPLEFKDDYKRVMLTCSTPHEKNVVTASADAEKALTTLAGLARSGDGKALWQLAQLVKSAVDGLNEIVRENPDAIKTFARHCDRWPMLRSTAPHLCEDDSLLVKIELGKSAGVQLDQHSKWKPDYAAVVAAKLIHHLEFIRRENPTGLDSGKKIEFSKFLLPFTKGSAPHWWFIAEKFLLATYPRPEEIEELDALVTIESKRKSPGRRRVAIREKIRARFFSLAP